MVNPVVLNSWKEISQYMGRSVRTLQRWERFGLPIHRPTGNDKSSVYALPHELQRWLAKGKPAESVKHEYHDRLRAIREHARDVIASMTRLRRNAETLQSQIKRSMHLQEVYELRRGRPAPADAGSDPPSAARARTSSTKRSA